MPSHGRASAHPNRLAGSKRERAGVPHVIGVFMGDKKRVQIVEVQIGRQQTSAQFFEAQATVDQQPRDLRAAAGFHQGGVARTAAA